MDKQTYLNSIKNLFKKYGVSETSSEKVVSEYEDLYNEALDSGYSHEEIVNRLGTAEVIFNSFKTELVFNSSKENKLVAISPFLAVIIFMVLGFGFNLWHPGWLVFFIIPLSGLLTDINKDNLATSSIFVVLAAYILVGNYYPDFFSYGISLFIIPVILFTLADGFNWKNIVLSLLLILSIVGQQIYGNLTGNWSFTWLIYAIPLCYAILVGKVKISVETSFLDKWTLTINLVILITYLVLLLVISSEAYWTWLILLLIPMTFIFRAEKFKHPVAYMPFISTILFFALGFIFNLWHIAWIVYLFIPMTAILTNEKE